MKKSLGLSVFATIIAVAVYSMVFIFIGKVPEVKGEIIFTGASVSLKIFRVHDFIVFFPFFVAIFYLLFYLKKIEDKNIKLCRLIGWGLALSLIMGVLVTMEVGHIYGLITSLLICLVFGVITGFDFVVIASLAFGLIIWIATAIHSGLLLGILPAIVIGLIFGAASSLGLGIKKILDLRR